MQMQLIVGRVDPNRLGVRAHWKPPPMVAGANLAGQIANPESGLRVCLVFRDLR
jgi:hypothetical protein